MLSKKQAKTFFIGGTLVTFLIFIGLTIYSFPESNDQTNYEELTESAIFSFYWMLTLFHVIYVLVGLVILISIYFGIKKKTTRLEDVEASAAFWHMCDLFWLLLFPLIYLFF